MTVESETPESFAPKQKNMTVEEAQVIFDKYFASKPKIKDLIEGSHAFAKKYKYIEIPESGFRRRLADVDSTNFANVQSALRQSLNTIVQGGSAYLMQCALNIINDFFHQNNVDASIIVTVHDSMVVSTKKELVPLVGAICKKVMENLPLGFLTIEHKGETIKFPMTADIGVSTNYNDECDYVEEEFINAVSSEGYCAYYHDLGHLKNLKNEKMISAEEHEALKENHEKWKSYYMSVNKMTDNQALYDYHTWVHNYRGNKED